MELLLFGRGFVYFYSPLNNQHLLVKRKEALTYLSLSRNRSLHPDHLAMAYEDDRYAPLSQN